jgi:hypothetical protein
MIDIVMDSDLGGPASPVSDARGIYFRIIGEAIQAGWADDMGQTIPVLPFLMPGEWRGALRVTE